MDVDVMTDGVARLSWWQRAVLRWWAWRERRAGVGVVSFGAWGEAWAARFLWVQGCRIVGRNVRPFRRGEVDLIARKGRVILFVEVKARRELTFGRPLQAVDAKKRKLLRKSATHWLAQRHLLGTGVLYRFDAVEVVGAPMGGVPKMNWVRQLNMEVAPQSNLFCL